MTFSQMTTNGFLKKIFNIYLKKYLGGVKQESNHATNQPSKQPPWASHPKAVQAILFYFWVYWGNEVKG